MCGINGYTRNNQTHPDTISRMNSATAHRGPDGVGEWSNERVALGQNLLAITEKPSVAKQPYVSEDGNFVMVYNGEVYNYKELRTEQGQGGATFKTGGDTEVIFGGLMRFGPEYFAKLDGMFAIAFYDIQKKKLYLARDSAGMKPLYYMKQGDALVFSSEIRGIFAHGIERKLNIEVAKLFFLLGYTPTEETLITGIQKVQPGAYLEVDLNSGEIRKEWFGWKDRIIDIPNSVMQGSQKASFGDFDPEILRSKIEKAVGEHTMGLRPFGLFLSGGLDSTVILHELSKNSKEKVRTYTTRFETKDPRYNEDADLAARLARDYAIDHHELLVTEKMFIERFDDAILAMEEPRYNHSVSAYWLLAERAAKDITIVLNGSGGDELFLGYPKYVNSANINAKYERYPRLLLDAYYSLLGVRDGFVALGNIVHLQGTLDRWLYLNRIAPPLGDVFRFMEHFDVTEAARMLGAGDVPVIREPLSDSTNAIAELDRWFWLANEEYMRTDKVIMHFGMEGRFPFLARELVRYANGTSSEIKLKNGKKSLLRDAYRDKLPDYILNKKKTGWNAPVAEWMSGDFGNMVREVLSPEYYQPTAELFDLSRLRKSELDGKTEFSRADLMRFLPIVQFQVWARALGATI